MYSLDAGPSDYDCLGSSVVSSLSTAVRKPSAICSPLNHLFRITTIPRSEWPDRQPPNNTVTPAKAGIYGVSRPVTSLPNVTPVSYVNDESPAQRVHAFPCRFCEAETCPWVNRDEPWVVMQNHRFVCVPFIILSYLIATNQATAGAPYPSKKNASGKSAQSTQKQTTGSNTPNTNSALYIIRKGQAEEGESTCDGGG